MIRREKRNATALVEMAVVISIFFLLLFGIIEYARLIYTRNVVLNATREGCRYAVVNVDDTSVVTDTQGYVKNYLGGLDQKLGTGSSGYACNVFWSDASGNNIGAAGSAPFGAYLCVQIQGTYTPSLPSFLMMGGAMPINFRTIMCAEAN